MKKNIILIGFMGSGKTTFGKWISNSQSRAMIDTDDYIEEKAGMSINDIFAKHGEAYFRNLETEVIKELITENVSDTVFSVGGGLPIKEENGALLKELGTVVYLYTDEDALVKRLMGDTKRPLLQGGDIREKIRSLMKARADIYEARADLILDTEKLSFEEMYERICAYEDSCN